MSRFTAANQPTGDRKRGKNGRTLIIEALKRQGESIDGFYDLLIKRALDPEDNFAAKEILQRIDPIKRSTMPMVEFDFPKGGTPLEQASAVMVAVSSGTIAPDIAHLFVTSIKSMIEIEKDTELKERIEALEKALGLE